MKKGIFNSLYGVIALILSVGAMQAAVGGNLHIINDLGYEVYAQKVMEERNLQNRSFVPDTIWSYSPEQLEDFGFHIVVIDTDLGTLSIKYPVSRSDEDEGAVMTVKLSEIENAARTLQGPEGISNQPAMIGDIAVYLSR
ncbi:hypothetical protein KC460_03820 [Candidatus Dependentiae bacterium]|nr:hypothetical protein [Candidatus Dependentiae bacterium]